MNLPRLLVPFDFTIGSSFLTRILAVGSLLTIIGFFLPISSKTSNNIFYLLVLIPFVISLFTKERDNYSLGKLSLVYFVFLLVMAVFSFSDEPVRSIKYALYMVVFWVVISSLVSRQIINVDRWGILLMAVSFFMALTILFIHFFIDREPFSSRPNFWQTWRSGNPIIVCVLLVFFMVIGIASLLKRNKIPIAIAIVAFSLVIQTFYQTRSGIAGLLGAAAFLLMTALSDKVRVKTMLIMGVVSMLSLFVFYEMGLFDTLIERGDSYRLDLYKISIQEYLECNRLTGCGYGYDFKSTLAGGVPISHPHSIYGSLLLYLGPVSLLAFLVLLVKAFIVNWKIRSNWFYGLAASCTFFLVEGKHILDHPNITWVCLVLPLAIIDGQSKISGEAK